ncbi:tRNA lysidine(34) synthetase TilS [Alloacidobacterium dinghuense]|uniref:tRNA(Ile)-lysidine synthase n=1 Tax=Alloacidobacterium dinghuense TaxID=2763107 RepID=A0A7G8BJQ8_9BACT|nr:tRNA lysidine(34) synthetase TilS [Alloacidobacterium dinghuense]QNI32778.1 tRNA lysidine(34) synthetase TilS [Alloacidobacterium dinghuense]
MPSSKQSSLPIVTDAFHPGMRLGVAVSGGADSVALLRRLAEMRLELGLVLTVLHVHHGIRGAEAEADAVFVEQMSRQLEIRFMRHDVNTIAHAEAEQETIEEAARNLRYAWFEGLLARGELEAVATAHTLDDQAETVLLKLLRGAWTEGLAGIFPNVERKGGLILRPLLRTHRFEIEAWLKQIGQSWREDSTNTDHAYTRNRVRHHLLPILAEYNPQIVAHLGHMASIARDEDAYWQKELERLLPSLLLPGKAVRGGGRANSTHPDQASFAIEVERLRILPLASRRRVLRAAAEQIGCSLNFDQTDLLLAMCENRAGRRETLTAQVHAERTPRELRLVRKEGEGSAKQLPAYEVPIPGEVVAEAFRLRLITDLSGNSVASTPPAILRVHKPGDRVQLRYSAGPKRIKEVFERMKVPVDQRQNWPVLEWQGEIVWIRGTEVESHAGGTAGLRIEVEELP